MYRVILPLFAVALLAAGCSTSAPSLVSGFADNGTPETSVASAESRRSRQGALGGDAAPAPSTTASLDNGRTRTASLDRAPSGSFDKAPKGALADRDYADTKLDAEKARALVNKYRADHKLKPLRLNAELTLAAKNHSRDLAKWDRISHFGSDGSNPWDRVKRAGYAARVAAENVGTGQITIEEVFKGWKESPGHNKNLLLADAEEMGIALVQEPKTEFKTFWVLVLGAKTR